MILLILTLIGFGGWNSFEEKRELKNSKNTIGTIIEIKERFQRGFFIKYEFQVNGRKYTENQKLTIKKEFIKIGDKFKVYYSKENPKYSKLQYKLRFTE
jgi:hypothetical protein